jgi:AAHS family 4-hydroxybenzoate transporter-like MFS transporter
LTPNTLDLSEVIDRSRLSPTQKAIIAICIAVAILDGMDAQLIGFAAPAIAVEFGIGPAAFGIVFAAGLVGMAVGSIFFGSIADRIGRRAVLITAVALFGAVTLLIPVLGSSIPALIALRFVAGLGLGGVAPTMIALLTEYMPARIRAVTIMVAVGSLSLGAFVAGIVASALIPSAGWRSVFIVGGVVPLVAALIVAVWLPDSLRFLMKRGKPAQAQRVLAKIDPSVEITPSTRLVDRTPDRSAVSALFARGRAGGTLVLWVVFFSNLLVLFGLLNWLPLLFQDAGLPSSVGTIAAALFALGGFVGGLVMGITIDRTGRPHLVVGIGFGVAMLGVVGVVLGISITPVLIVSAILAGAGFTGAQTGISAIAASMYPTSARASGVGWAYGVGRVGSIFGPVISGVLLAAGLGATSIVGLALVPGALALAGISVLGARAARARASEGAVDAVPAEATKV